MVNQGNYALIILFYYYIILNEGSWWNMKNVHEIEIKVEGKEWEKALDKAFDKKKN